MIRIVIISFSNIDPWRWQDNRYNNNWTYSHKSFQFIISMVQEELWFKYKMSTQTLTHRYHLSWAQMEVTLIFTYYHMCLLRIIIWRVQMLQIYGLGKQVWTAKEDQEVAKEELMNAWRPKKESLETSSTLGEIALGLWKLQHRGTLSQAYCMGQKVQRKWERV